MVEIASGSDVKLKQFRVDTWADGKDKCMDFVNNALLANRYTLVDIGFTATAIQCDEVIFHVLYKEVENREQPTQLKIDWFYGKSESWASTFRSLQSSIASAGGAYFRHDFTPRTGTDNDKQCYAVFYWNRSINSNQYTIKYFRGNTWNSTINNAVSDANTESLKGKRAVDLKISACADDDVIVSLVLTNSATRTELQVSSSSDSESWNSTYEDLRSKVGNISPELYVASSATPREGDDNDKQRKAVFYTRIIGGSAQFIGKWRLVNTVINPKATHTYKYSVKVGISRTDSFNTSFTSETSMGIKIQEVFNASQKFSITMSTSSAQTFSKETTEERSITVNPGESVATWQWIMEGQVNGLGCLLQSSIFRDTGSQTEQPPPLEA